MTRRLFSTLLATLVVLLVAAPAQAGLLPVRVSVTPEGTDFRWTYAILLQDGSQLQAGDYFTIYDFGGYLDGTNSQPDGWTFSSANVGTTPDRLNPDDDASLPNLTFTYSGSTIDGWDGLGNFWVLSQYQDTADEHFTAQTHRTQDGMPDSNITETLVPVPVGPQPTVPEPATLALAGLGLPFIALARRWKR